jgi:sulfite reductase beta subunit-like hemoprotein
LVARSRELNVALPNRLNISLGGCTQCGLEALTNDIGLVACVQDGEPGYQLWAGGSLGTAPRLSLMLRPFVPRAELWPAVWSIVEWFLTEGDVEQVTKGRLKFLIDARGESAFRAAFTKRFAAMRLDDTPPPPPIEITPNDDLVRTLAQAPALGWRHTVRPERRAGCASITVRVPLGDLRADDLVALAELAPEGRIVLTRDQNVLVPSVPVDAVSRVVGELGARDLGPEGALGAADVRACPGLSFCSLAITGSQPVAMAIERAMNVRQDLPRDVVISVSGCPNSCTMQQVGDVGLSGTKVKVAGKVGLGYQLWLGADLPGGMVGEPVLRLTEDEVPQAVIATVELWVALRRPGETPGATFRRTGLDVVGDALEVRLREFGFGERPVVADDALLGAA